MPGPGASKADNANTTQKSFPQMEESSPESKPTEKNSQYTPTRTSIQTLSKEKRDKQLVTDQHTATARKPPHSGPSQAKNQTRASAEPEAEWKSTARNGKQPRTTNTKSSGNEDPNTREKKDRQEPPKARTGREADTWQQRPQRKEQQTPWQGD
ncbi:hypothetical protein NDU88_005599 [Pleurodeles waltl]|uniref:Uncharacterized protein n=1 Tax=Pleurodeles waltl TaxID=8319 RepID=A0AAV7RNR2_PLEWA|nr:hypothetical protein NDU88_005599 [Pleurodeles waltl]